MFQFPWEEVSGVGDYFTVTKKGGISHTASLLLSVDDDTYTLTIDDDDTMEQIDSVILPVNIGGSQDGAMSAANVYLNLKGYTPA